MACLIVVKLPQAYLSDGHAVYRKPTRSLPALNSEWEVPAGSWLELSVLHPDSTVASYFSGLEGAF